MGNATKEQLEFAVKELISLEAIFADLDEDNVMSFSILSKKIVEIEEQLKKLPV